MTNYIKTCSILLAHFTETMKEVEILFSKKAYGEQLIFWKDICCISNFGLMKYLFASLVVAWL